MAGGEGREGGTARPSAGAAPLTFLVPVPGAGGGLVGVVPAHVPRGDRYMPGRGAAGCSGRGAGCRTGCGTRVRGERPAQAAAERRAVRGRAPRRGGDRARHAPSSPPGAGAELSAACPPARPGTGAPSPQRPRSALLSSCSRRAAEGQGQGEGEGEVRRHSPPPPRCTEGARRARLWGPPGGGVAGTAGALSPEGEGEGEPGGEGAGPPPPRPPELRSRVGRSLRIVSNLPAPAPPRPPSPGPAPRLRNGTPAVRKSTAPIPEPGRPRFRAEGAVPRE